MWIVLSFGTQTLGVASRAIEHQRTKYGRIEFTWMALDKCAFIKLLGLWCPLIVCLAN
jgi:hypothetical protein